MLSLPLRACGRQPHAGVVVSLAFTHFFLLKVHVTGYFTHGQAQRGRVEKNLPKVNPSALAQDGLVGVIDRLRFSVTKKCRTTTLYATATCMRREQCATSQQQHRTGTTVLRTPEAQPILVCRDRSVNIATTTNPGSDSTSTTVAAALLLSFTTRTKKPHTKETEECS